MVSLSLPPQIVQKMFSFDRKGSSIKEDWDAFVSPSGFAGTTTWLPYRKGSPIDSAQCVPGPEGCPYYVARASAVEIGTFGKASNGKLGKGKGWFPYKGREKTPSVFEVLLKSPKYEFFWSSMARIISDDFRVYKENDYTPFCVEVKGELSIGKYYIPTREGYVTHGGKEYHLKKSELDAGWMLCVRPANSVSRASSPARIPLSRIASENGYPSPMRSSAPSTLSMPSTPISKASTASTPTTPSSYSIPTPRSSTPISPTTSFSTDDPTPTSTSIADETTTTTSSISACADETFFLP